MLAHIKASTGIYCLLFFLGSNALAAAVPATTDWAPKVAPKMAMLASGTPEEKEAATDWLMNSDPEALPAIETAAAAMGEASGGAVAKRIVQTLRPLAAKRAALEARRRDDETWNLREGLESFEKFGVKDPKWDERARTALTHLFSRTKSDNEAELAILDALNVSPDYKDPLVWYVYARRSEMSKKDLNRTLAAYLNTTAYFHAGKYPAFRKCNAYANYVRFVGTLDLSKSSPVIRDREAQCAKEMLALWPEAVAEPGASRKLIRDLADLILAGEARLGTDRAKVIDEMLPPYEKAFPSDALTFAGASYTHYAWDARGSGFADTVTPEGWKQFAERLKIAEKLLTTAYDRDPTDAVAATEMLSVELGQSQGRDVMEKWFKRAVDADPTHYSNASVVDAYSAKLYYLQDRWNGSVLDRLAFGRECAATRDYRDRIPEVLMEVLRELADQSGDANGYWRNPVVWTDVSSVVRPQAMADPVDAWAGSRYAYWAWKCGEWKLADEQFKRLGDRAVPAVWTNKAEFDSARAESALKAVSAIVPPPVAGLPSRAAAAPSVPRITLPNSEIEVTPIAGWESAESNGGLSFLTADRLTMVYLKMLPPEETVAEASAPAMQAAERAKPINERFRYLSEPTAEPDDRFTVKIHARMQIKENNQVWDQYYIYRTLGGRTLKAQFTLGGFPGAKLQPVQAAAERLIMSAAVHGEKPIDPAVLEPNFVAGVVAACVAAEAALKAGDDIAALRQAPKLSPLAKDNPKLAPRVALIRTELESRGRRQIDAAAELSRAKQYTQAAAKLREVASNLPGTPTGELAAKRLGELEADPAVKASLAAADRNEKTALALTAARKLKADKKTAEAYLAYQSIAKDSPGTSAAREAAAEISKWDLDPTASAEIRRKIMDSPAEAKAKGALNMARNYVAAKQFEQAKSKYADVVKLYPGTVCANVAAKEMAELPTPEAGK